MARGSPITFLIFVTIYTQYIREKMNVVRSCISLERDQIEFLKKNGYSKSLLLRNQINELMKKSEGQDTQSQPTDESQEGDSNNG